MIPINSIDIPARFRHICNDWAGNETCMLRAVSSTGSLTTGTICPVSDYTDDDDKMRKWYLIIWRDLCADICYVLRVARINSHFDEEFSDLVAFEGWADWQVSRLCESYGLEDWS